MRSKQRSNGQRAEQHTCHNKAAQMIQDLRALHRLGGSSRRRGRGGILDRPVCIHGGVTGEHGGGADLGAADRLRVPAVEGVAFQRGLLGQSRELAAQVGGDDHYRGGAAHGVQTDGVDLCFLCVRSKGGGHGAAQQHNGRL